MVDTARPYEVRSDDGIPVTLPSGAIHYVMTDDEERYLNDKIRRYLDDNHFVNVSDLLDVDKMVVTELLVHRWSLWMSRGRDYYDDDINPKTYSDMIKDHSTEIRQLKKSLGVDKSSRDRTRGDDSVAALWSNLQRRAREFGYLRNEQYVQVITSFQRLKAILQFHDNCDAVERKENHCEIEDVLDVLREEIEKFDAIDEKFRFEKQTLWIRQQ